MHSCRSFWILHSLIITREVLIWTLTILIASRKIWIYDERMAANCLKSGCIYWVVQWRSPPTSKVPSWNLLVVGDVKPNASLLWPVYVSTTHWIWVGAKSNVSATLWFFWVTSFLELKESILNLFLIFDKGHPVIKTWHFPQRWRLHVFS